MSETALATDAFSYTCQRCSAQTREKFAVHKPTQVWITDYPERQLVHIHYGYSTTHDRENIDEAKFVTGFLNEIRATYPVKKFFLVVDFTRGDDSEFVPPEAMKMYRAILEDEFLRQGAIYGATYALRSLVSLLFLFKKVNVHFVNTEQEAEQAYQKWYKATVKT